MARNPLIRPRPRPRKIFNESKSKGILDDAPVRKTIASKQGTIEHTPSNDSDIANKKYVDSLIGRILVVTANPASAEEGQIILNSTVNIIYIWYSGEWKVWRPIDVGTDFLLKEDGDFILLETGDEIIL